MIPHVTPLSIVSGTLIHTIGTSACYREVADRLLMGTSALDAHLAQAIQAVPRSEGRDYFLDAGRLDREMSRGLSLRLRSIKEEVDAHYPLLSHAAGLVDYVAHLTTNPAVSKSPRFLASVSESGEMRYSCLSCLSPEWSIGIYLGLSPCPLFGSGLRYDERLCKSLSRMGFGVFAYLLLATRPEIGFGGVLPPWLAYADTKRNVARACLEQMRDGSWILLSATSARRR